MNHKSMIRVHTTKNIISNDHECDDKPKESLQNESELNGAN